MKFGLFYEHQIPRPWTDQTELEVYSQALDQIELADRLGFEYVWEVEHHFLEEYSHSSAPEVFLAAVSQRTKNIRLGHGVMLSPPRYNPPARVAERIATLDLVSGGRVEWGTGESASAMEMGGFGIDPEQKSAMWREATEQTANMLAMTPYPGFEGEFFSMPCRNIVPKSAQRPHPPMWVACSRRETIHRAARHGLGALSFAFIEPEQANKWVREYYDIIKSSECVPIGHSVNPNFALVSGMSVHDDEQEAIARGLDGFRFFGYSLGYYGKFGEHKPGLSDVWRKFEESKAELKDNAGRGGIGTPDQVRDHFDAYEQAGVDQMIFVQQSGRNRHENICESLELFAKRLLPDFKTRDRVREQKKQSELAPFVEAALARKPRMPVLAHKDIPSVRAFGLLGVDVGTAQSSTYSDRGGAISVPMMDPSSRK
jgi:alkanesulfonate monooxygenase SsuD/methylene tetrahydromethanopterin reductase-like flavin-dependent oxidoreductase (luciferase family)